MQIALHIGAHATDNEQIVGCLLGNRSTLAERGIVVPEPQRYRPVIRETLKLLRNQEVPPDAQEAVMDAVLGTDNPKRLILSHEGFLGPAGNSVGENMLYPHTDGRTRELVSMFARHELEIFLAVQDPATFVPSAFSKAQEPDFAVWTAGTDPMTLRWSDMIDRLRDAAPDAEICVWCNEDTPMIWPQVIEAIVGGGDMRDMIGLNAFLGSLMGPAGLKRLESYLADHPPKSEDQRRRVVAAFLEKFARDEVLEQEIDLPGWTASYVDALTDLYDEDVARIAQMRDVRFIAP